VLQSTELWASTPIIVPSTILLRGSSIHSGINFARFRDVLFLQPSHTASSEVVLRHLCLSNLPEAAPDAARGGGDTRALLALGSGGEIRGDSRALLGHGSGGEIRRDTRALLEQSDSGGDTRAVLGQVTSLINDSVAIRVEACEAVVECDEVKFLQHFAQRLQAGPGGRSNAHVTFQVRCVPVQC
jgi:hypothetical protein